MGAQYMPQEEDVIGLLPEEALVASMQPLSDRILIKVGVRQWRPVHVWVGGGLQARVVLLWAGFREQHVAA